MEIQVTVKSLCKHAKQYGPEGVLEFARDVGFDRAALAEILTACDLKDPRHPVVPKTFNRKQLTVEQRISRFLGDEQED